MGIYYRNAMRYRMRHYSRTGVLAYRALLAAGMLLRALSAAPISTHGGTRDAARGFVEVAAMALRGLPGEASR